MVDEDDYGDIDVELPENMVYKLGRLEKEGYVDDMGEVVEAALSYREPSEGFSIDPSIKHRLSELNFIEEKVAEDRSMRENPAVEMFADNTYYTQKFARLSVDEDFQRRKELESKGLDEDVIEEKLWRRDIEQQLALIDNAVSYYGEDSIRNDEKGFTVGTIGFMEKFRAFAQYQGLRNIDEELEDFLDRYFSGGELREDIDL